jgi:hypothetical protein
MTAIASGDLRAYLRWQAGRVWQEQGGAIKHGFFLQEETITETLLLRLAQDLTPKGLKVKLFTRIEEGGVTRKDGTVEKVGNGADWEWFIDLPDCMVGFRVQAKRLSQFPIKDGYYSGIKVGGSQIDDLINLAGKSNPVYVFYNHGHVKNASLFTRSAKTNWFGQNAWGCSVATASFVKGLKTNSLSEAFSGMVPWHRFFVVGNTKLRGCAVERTMRAMVGGQEFKLADERPDWIKLLLARDHTDEGVGSDFSDHSDDAIDAEPSDLNNLLKERGLRGVAYFDFKNFGEE